MIDLDEGDSELARWKHQVRLLERENRELREQAQREILRRAQTERALAKVVVKGGAA